jgi:flagellar L-ring protein precursor FlgH
MNASLKARTVVAFVVGLAWSVAAATPALAQTPAPVARPAIAKTYDEAYQRYLASARQLDVPANMWMADLMTDPSARRVGDLVTIRVIESLSATGTAGSNVGKASSAKVNVPMPTIPKVAMPANDLLKWGPIEADSKFNGTGSSTRTTELSATMTARVAEVLPNGTLVLEGVREIDINGDRSLVVLTGVVRPIDIQPGNVVPSSQIGQLRIQSLSQGLIKDSLTPGVLVRLLNKIF